MVDLNPLHIGRKQEQDDTPIAGNFAGAYVNSGGANTPNERESRDALEINIHLIEDEGIVKQLEALAFEDRTVERLAYKVDEQGHPKTIEVLRYKKDAEGHPIVKKDGEGNPIPRLDINKQPILITYPGGQQQAAVEFETEVAAEYETVVVPETKHVLVRPWALAVRNLVSKVLATRFITAYDAETYKLRARNILCRIKRGMNQTDRLLFGHYLDSISFNVETGFDDSVGGQKTLAIKVKAQTLTVGLKKNQFEKKGAA